MHWKQKGPTDVAKGMQRKPDKMLPFNEIGHAKEKSLVGDVDEDSESYVFVEISGGSWLGLKLRGLKTFEGLNRMALGVAGMNENQNPGQARFLGRFFRMTISFFRIKAFAPPPDQ